MNLTRIKNEYVFDMISASDVNHALNWSWAGLNFLSWWHCCILIIWPFNALVVGFSNGTFLHIVPIALEIFVLKVVSVAINGFGAEGVNASDIKMKQRVIVLASVVLGVAIGCNVAHAIYTLVVTIQDALTIDSTLYWFLIVFSIVLLVLALLEAIMIYYLVKLRQHIGLVVKVKAL
jgi:hypothetical protein